MNKFKEFFKRLSVAYKFERDYCRIDGEYATKWNLADPWELRKRQSWYVYHSKSMTFWKIVRLEEGRFKSIGIEPDTFYYATDELGSAKHPLTKLALQELEETRGVVGHFFEADLTDDDGFLARNGVS